MLLNINLIFHFRIHALSLVIHVAENKPLIILSELFRDLSWIGSNYSDLWK